MVKSEQKQSTGDKVVNRIKSDNERGARTNLIEELFNDFNRSKSQVFWMNFQRGILFGVGSVIGGALAIALLGFILSLFVDLPGGVGDFVQRVVDAMNQRR